MCWKDNLSLIAQMDQLGASLEISAAVLGQFYRALLKENIPTDVACPLVTDMQKRLFGNDRRGG